MCFSTLRKSELFVASRDGKIRCFDIDSRRLLKTLTGHRHAVTAISFHPFKALMTTSSVESLSVWDLKKWKKIRTLGAGSGVVTSNFTPDGKLLLIAFRDDSILGWSTSDFENTIRFDVPRRLEKLTITSLSVSTNGRFLVAGGKRRELMCWSMTDQLPLRAVELPSSVTQVLDITFLPDSTTISILADDGTVRFVDIGLASESDSESRRPVEHTITRRGGHVLQVVYDANAKFAACCVSDGSLLLYDLEIARAYTTKVREARIKMGGVAEDMTVMLDTIEGQEKLVEKPPRKSPVHRHHSSSSAAAGGEVVQVPGAPQAPPSMRTVNEEDGIVMETKWEMTDKYETKIAQAAHDLGTSSEGINVGSTSTTTAPSPKKDAAYWLQQSMPPPSRTMPTSELLEEAFGTKIPSHSTDVLRKQRRQERQRRTQQQNALSPGAYPLVNNGGRESGSTRLSRPRLAKLLRTYGRFPSKYRLTIWKYLLNLPGNQSAYNTLVKKGLHPRYSDLERQWPVRDQRVLRNFRRLLSALAHWVSICIANVFVVFVFVVVVEVVYSWYPVDTAAHLFTLLHTCWLNERVTEVGQQPKVFLFYTMSHIPISNV